MRRVWIPLALLWATMVGCAPLRLTPIQLVAQRPGEVTVYFRVRRSSGQPVRGLTAADFRIYEDDRLVAPAESAPVVSSADAAVSHDLILLLDLSAGVTETGDDEVIPEAVSAFTVRMGSRVKTAVYAFDGSPDLYPLAPFTPPSSPAPRRGGKPRPRPRRLAAVKPKDPSNSLNGALLAAIDRLETALAHADRPVKSGTLVVFTSGPDNAHRVSTAAMERRLAEVPFDIFAIGVGPGVTVADLGVIGRTGAVVAPDKDDIVKAFDDVAQMIEARTDSSYVLSYRSPSRAGRHEVRVEAVMPAAEGGSHEVGSLRVDFDATGFGPPASSANGSSERRSDAD